MAEKEKFDTIKLIDGEYKTQLNRFYRERKKWEPVNDKVVLSFMPGNVIEYKVTVGQKVSKGETLLTFRAMKMNNIINSHRDGVIKSLGSEPGVNIPKNSLLIEFE